MKEIFRTSTGKHIIEATSSELANLLLAKKSLDTLCDQFEFTIEPTAPPAQSDAGSLKSTPCTLKSTPPSVQSRHTQAKDLSEVEETRMCAVCGKEFEVKRKDQRCCSTACGKKSHPKKPTSSAKKAAPKARPNASGDAPLYLQVAEMLRVEGPMTTPDIVKAMFARGVVTTRAKIGIMVCNYKKLFHRVDGHKYAATKPAAKPVAQIKTPPPPPAPQRTTVSAPKPDRMAAIRAADQKARLKASGIHVPANVFGSDSGIGAPTDEDIEHIRAGKED